MLYQHCPREETWRGKYSSSTTTCEDGLQLIVVDDCLPDRVIAGYWQLLISLPLRHSIDAIANPDEKQTALTRKAKFERIRGTNRLCLTRSPRAS